MTWQQDAPTATLQSEPRKLRGLRFPVIPTGGWLAQIGGGIAALVGSFMQFGTPITLIAAGLAAVVLGTLREAEKI
jgi:hypothetical protein